MKWKFETKICITWIKSISQHQNVCWCRCQTIYYLRAPLWPSSSLSFSPFLLFLSLKAASPLQMFLDVNVMRVGKHECHCFVFSVWRTWSRSFWRRRSDTRTRRPAVRWGRFWRTWRRRWFGVWWELHLSPTQRTNLSSCFLVKEGKKETKDRWNNTLHFLWTSNF